MKTKQKWDFSDELKRMNRSVGWRQTEEKKNKTRKSWIKQKEAQS